MIAVTLIDIAITGALTCLAWHFGKWWIILFTPLLMVSYKQKGADDDSKRD